MIHGIEQPAAAQERSSATNTFESAPEEWKLFYQTFQELRRKVLNKILNDKDGDTYLKTIQAKETSSFASVENPQRYLTYHISLAGSTGPISSPELDFSGEHSLLSFYEKLAEKLGL